MDCELNYPEDRCETHDRAEPCRFCLWEESGAETAEQYLGWLRGLDDNEPFDPLTFSRKEDKDA